MSKGFHAPSNLVPNNLAPNNLEHPLRRQGAAFFKRDANGNFVATPRKPVRPTNNTNNPIDNSANINPRP